MPSSIHNQEEPSSGRQSSYVEVPVASRATETNGKQPATGPSATSLSAVNSAHLPGDERQGSSYAALGLNDPTVFPVDTGSNIDDLTVIHRRERDGSRVTGATSPVLEMATFLEGTDLDQYHINTLIGGGGMGAVFKARDNQLGRDVAVKVLNQTTREMVRRFDQEAKAAAQLTHQNIAIVYGAGFAEGWHYIAFELIEGKNIRDIVVGNGCFTPEEAIPYTLQVVDALAHADERGLVHRDIKPSNIVITPTGLVKVVDLGLARVSQSEASGEALTASGVAMGTFDYCSPEQAEDPRRTDVRSDIYSLGCTLYFMLTGRPPFAHEPPGLAKMLAHRSKRVPDPRQFVPDLPLPVAAIIMRMLAKNPSHRQQTAKELHQDLLKLQVELRKARLTPAGNGLLHHLPWISAFVLLAASGMGAYQYMQPAASEATGFAPVMFPAASGETAAAALPGALVEPAAVGPTTPDATPEVDAPEEGGATKPPMVVPSIVIPTDNTGQFTETNPLDAATGGSASGPAAAGVSAGDNLPAALTGSSEEGATVAVAEEGDQAEVTAGSTADAPSTGSAVAAPRVAVVAAEGASHAEDEAIYTSFAAACQAAASQPSIKLVELRFNGPLSCEPFEVYGGSLTIQAAAGYSPVVHFPVDADDAPDTGSMIRVAGGQLKVTGVDFQVELPSRPFDINWAVFELDNAVGASLKNCSLTVVNLAPGGVAAQYNVTFFSVNGPSEADGGLDMSDAATAADNADAEGMPTSETSRSGMPSDMQPRPAASARTPAAATTPPLIELANCVVRGQATLVNIPAATQLRMQWTQGLFLSTRHMVEVSSSSVKPRLRDLVQITLDHVTVATHESLCLVQQSADAPYQAGLKVHSTNCIYVTRSGAPLIEHIGVEDMEMTKRLLAYTGSNNFYPATRVVWRVSNENGLLKQYDFDDALSESWFDDQLPQQAVIWENPLDVDGDKQVHLLGPTAFQLKQQASNPAYGSGKNVAGFTPGALHNPPVMLSAKE